MSEYDPTHIGALETGWEEGYDAAVAHTTGGPVPRNPYTKLRDDRLEYVRRQVVEQFGDLDRYDNEDFIDQDDVLDAILNAHADWLAGHTAPVGTPDNIRVLITAATAVVRELRGDGPSPHTDEPADIIEQLVAAVIAGNTSDCCDADPCLLPAGHDGECRR